MLFSATKLILLASAAVGAMGATAGYYPPTRPPPPPPAPVTGTHLKVTAIGAANGKSRVECWTLDQAFAEQAPGLNVLQLGDTTQASYSESPLNRDFRDQSCEAENHEIFLVLAGEVTITFPQSKETLSLVPGKWYITVDTKDVSRLGHTTTYKKGTRVLQFPFARGVIPPHTAVVGKCKA